MLVAPGMEVGEGRCRDHHTLRHRQRQMRTTRGCFTPRIRVLQTLLVAQSRIPGLCAVLSDG